MSFLVEPLNETKAFKKIKVGSLELNHRIFFCPCTRLRSLSDGTPSDLNLQFYSNRSKVPGTLVVTEGTFPGEKLGVYPGAPRIHSQKHVEAWKDINNKIHGNGSFSAVQLVNIGRKSDPEDAKRRGYKVYGPSNIYGNEQDRLQGEVNPLQELTLEDIDSLIEEYVEAGKRAIEAGFDFIELHMCQGYLLDTFLFPSSNQRTDKYGGSIENRARLPLELIDKFIQSFGADKVGIRLSPWATFQDMRAQNEDIHPIVQLGYLVNELEKRGKKGERLAYISLIEPRVLGSETVDTNEQVGNNDFIKQIWSGIILKAGNYTYDAPKFGTLVGDLDDDRTLVGFGRFFLSNPDLVDRLKKGKPLTQYDRSLFYTSNNYGYNTWTESGVKIEFNKEKESLVVPASI